MSNDNKPDLTKWIEVLNISTYSLNAIKKVCYQFSSTFSVKLEKIDEENVKVFFMFSEPLTSEKIDFIISSFYQALLDQDLREIVSRETEGVRNLILAHAFSKTTLIDPE
ncbi:TPA: His-Xaa-Ser system protein HxsD [Legionella pneumophila]|uniref:His-Xaa-Ser system protein HxsD n=1 Tax=Legionella pneumophila TaxID=446 RepID=UPI0004BB586F|nr:His-Xaa-Ser system protein HxsD [Legionella pneumophila]AOW57605.1 His-Xaa-Ser system protein HxsD [Legionella pneumophila subsp. pneumophila]AOW62214.1 His-Xaa-Ser system protein HxsD [Legionella pneumophila subsp. pneumophila]AOW68317.1 His-Xaa-Ser system protein HxsD [Legionella pneumophila subsp. pneumophila]MCK0183496.1 His-Xaa-Ser system protein HxsD [Legionella pneumophila]MCK1881066.1 His-Xaa-Ser system protein HxsD [Legionella pneumophila]